METVRQQGDSASLALYCSNGTCEMRVGSHLALYAHYSRSVSSTSDLFFFLFFFLSVLSVTLQYHSDDNISNNSSPGSILEVRSMTFIMTSLFFCFPRRGFFSRCSYPNGCKCGSSKRHFEFAQGQNLYNSTQQTGLNLTFLICSYVTNHLNLSGRQVQVCFQSPGSKLNME